MAALEGFETFLKADLLPRSTGQFALGREDYDFIPQHRWLLHDDASAILAKAKNRSEPRPAELSSPSVGPSPRVRSLTVRL